MKVKSTKARGERGVPAHMVLIGGSAKKLREFVELMAIHRKDLAVFRNEDGSPWVIPLKDGMLKKVQS